MKVGFFTDTYFPQVSGVSTSIRTLKQELEARGHEVYIFTTTDPNACDDEPRVIRMPSIPFIYFKERRIMVRGMTYAYSKCKELELDLIHTHTEFGVGLLGKLTAKGLGIPCVHTYHTMYEDYLHYIAHGKLIRPSHVKHISRLFIQHLSGVICPSQRVVDKLEEYGVETPKRIIPTGIDIEKFRPVAEIEKTALKEAYHLDEDAIVLLSVSRISYEKNIQTLLYGMPDIVNAFPKVKLLVVGDGPFKKDLEKLVKTLSIEEHVIFTGEIANNKVSIFYQIADVFVSASDSETQGLTYTEAMAAGTQVVAKGNSYLNGLFDKKSLGQTFEENNQFASTLIEYIQDKHLPDKADISKKLYDISSVAFGERVEQFYEDSNRHYYLFQQDKTLDNDLDDEGMTAIKFLKNKF
ncbi:1,2-diacylglycerol 3-glucosyltransferase [Vagococcus penaei]|uniref:1,2-diacylglycerol 3-glucosyltransferase n=1 Tax=Vagococcus penaei TaxID=633807 RepID=A0A1Q2D3R4_9ENTE|nr:glycosyltransferase family 4 protein [Vagococcus penaei]AQP52998.1 1,2-diacylglycerol 3-glucosyltransferase [Vagococcus penaei]RSU02542.1 1,2-diacylglycerol 3-glucosyltransferase [Vagococcus penaei]